MTQGEYAPAILQQDRADLGERQRQEQMNAALRKVCSYSLVKSLVQMLNERPLSERTTTS